MCCHGLRKTSEEQHAALQNNKSYCQTSDLGLRLEVDFVFHLSQEEQEQEPLTKIYRIELN